MTPDDLYTNGLRDVPTEAILRLAEHVLDLAAQAGLESDDRPRLALAMLKRGETYDAARLARRTWKQMLRHPRTTHNKPWSNVVEMVSAAAVLAHERRSCATYGMPQALNYAGSVVWALGMFGIGAGSGRQAHDYVRALLVKFSVNTTTLEP